jgi:hypothetical protein
MREVTSIVYKFEELSDEAKKRAREWYTSDYDHVFYDFVYDDAAAVAKILGFDICQTRKQLMNGEHRYAPTIFWSGFWSQGDGACFEGSYSWNKGCVEAIKKYAPNDTELHNIAYSLWQMQRPWFYKLTGSVKHRGHYYHERSMDCQLDHSEYSYGYNSPLPEDEFKEICADFARWIYKQLENEYEYQTSDEVVDDAMNANEYEFDEDGNIQ